MKRFEFIVEDDGDRRTLSTTNDGFNAAELLGYLEMKRQDIMHQVLEPDSFKRTLIDDDGNKVQIEDK